MVFLLRFLTLILSSALIEVILANSIPNRQKREHDERRLAKQQNKVYLPKELAMNLFFPASVLSAIGVLLILFPQICESVGFDYPITLFIAWIPLLLKISPYLKNAQITVTIVKPETDVHLPVPAWKLQPGKLPVNYCILSFRLPYPHP